MKEKLLTTPRSFSLLLLLTIILVQSSIVAASPAHQDGDVTVFTHVNVIPMDSERILEDQTVIVRGDRIAEIGPAEQVSVPSEAQVVDGQGAFLMPGLADMHYHLDQNPVSLTMAVANGVTTVQNLNALPEEIALAARTEAGDLVGPRIINGPHTAGLPPDFGFMFRRVNEAVGPFFSLHEYLLANPLPDSSFFLSFTCPELAVCHFMRHW